MTKLDQNQTLCLLIWARDALITRKQMCMDNLKVQEVLGAALNFTLGYNNYLKIYKISTTW